MTNMLTQRAGTPSSGMALSAAQLSGPRALPVASASARPAAAGKDTSAKPASVATTATAATSATTANAPRAKLPISNQGVAMIKRYEGFRTKAYQDSGGVWTIGYGHTKGVKPGQVITEKQGDAFLRADLKSAETSVARLVKVPLTQGQQDALVSFQFNTGSLGKSTLLRKLNQHDYAGAQKQFKRWVHDSKGHELRGLVKRRAEEAKMFGSKPPAAAKHSAMQAPNAATASATGVVSASAASASAASASAASASAPAARKAPAPGTAAYYATQFLKHADKRARTEFANHEKVVLAIRKDTPTYANRGQGVYDDRIVVLQKTKSGAIQSTVFMGNVDPAGKYLKRGYGYDINHDGKKDLGRLVSGTYHYVKQPGTRFGSPYFKADATQQVLRDTNHDGHFTRADMLDRTHAGRTDLIHVGGKGTTGSAGCQTMRPSDYSRFMAKMGSDRQFSYVLV